MLIGIDISQLAYENTGVANYLYSLIQNLTALDGKNEYLLFYSSLRKRIKNSKFKFKNINPNVRIIEYWLPPTILNLIWNKFHILPIENFIGDIDIFITSDWTEPPTKRAKKATILYDLIVYKYPKESSDKIVTTQKQKLKWVKKETDKIFCISNSTRKDAVEVLGISEDRLAVIGAGIKI